MEDVNALLMGKTAVITGADGGIGSRIVKMFAENKANIIACVRKSNSRFEKEIMELSSANEITVDIVCFDMGDQDSVKKGIKDIKSLKKPVDVLINNAGVGHLALVPMITMDDMKRVFQINYFSHVQIVQGLYRSLSKTKGCIVNLASVAGIDGDRGNTIYGASKASMILFTKVLSKEMSPEGVRVNAVAPGLVNTGFADAMGDKAKESMISSSLMHRLASPEEIAKTVLFLASENSSFINGQIIRIDGGM